MSAHTVAHTSYHLTTAGLVGALLLAAVGCGDGDISTYDVEVEGSDGPPTILSGSVGADEPDLTTTAWITPGILYVTLDDDDGRVELTVVTSESETAPGSFEVTTGQHTLRYTLPDQTVYQSIGGTIDLVSCPTGLDDRARGSFTDVEAQNAESDDILTLHGSFDMVLSSIQYNGDDEPLDCE